MAWFSFKRRSFFVKMLLSFLAVLLLPLAISSLFYSRFENILAGHAGRSNMALLDQIRQAVDSQMEDFDKIRIHISMNTDVQWLLNFGSDDSPEVRQKYIRVMNDLKGLDIPSGFIQSLYLYFPASDIVLTDSLKTDSGLFFRNILPNVNLAPESSLSRINAFHSGTFYPVETVLEGTQARKIIPFIQSLPLEAKSGLPQGSLVILISESYIQSLLENISQLNQGRVVVLDEHGQIILSTESQSGGRTIPLDRITGNAGQFSDDSQKKTEIVSFTRSDVSGWTFVSAIPEDVVMAEVERNRYHAIAILSISLAAGLLTAYILSYRNYTPVRKVLRDISQLWNTGRPKGNEMEWISHTLQTSWQEERDLRQALSREIPVVRANFLSRLIRGLAWPERLSPESLEFMKLNFRHPYFGVLLIQIENSSSFAVSERELANFIVSNISAELLESAGHVVELEQDRIAVLMNRPDDSPETAKEIHNKGIQLLGLLNERFHMGIVIGIGELHHGLESAALSYREALNALDYRVVRGINSVNVYEKNRSHKRTYYHYPVEVESMLINLGKCGDYEGCFRALNDVFEANFSEGFIPPEMAKCLYLELISTLFKLLNSLGLDQAKVFGRELDPLQLIEQAAAPDSMHAMIAELYGSICLYVADSQTDRSDELFNRIKEYVDSRYADSMFSLTSMADDLGMNGKYLSAFYKKYSGRNLSDYLASVRVQQAKKLLRETPLTIEQIAHRVGYANDAGLIRVFRKLEGVTPGKYRDQIGRPE
ncbi:helix-turn-helix domain-containing protein [Paenibacillus sp. YN15]|uniref:helix-turn-helix domain-containing protein n=1 Tax=Paenibacillus sp. YN15 TaxID=1742774 RepID=UPI0015EC39FF|nr:helix-turn-helix domain-containing protein [Paenibacillus sp. YN15]